MEQELIQKYLHLDGCRRAFLNTIYNDQAEQFCGPHDLPCDFCTGRQLVLNSSSYLVTVQNQEWAKREATLQGFIQFFQAHCIACILGSLAPMAKLGVVGWDFEGGINHMAGPDCPNHKKYRGIIRSLSERAQGYPPGTNSCHFRCWLPTRFCRQWFGGGARSGASSSSSSTDCPGGNPIFIWASLIGIFGAWFLVAEDYRPVGYTNGKLGRQQFLEWFYQVDFEFFNTEALRGVVVFYLWAEKAQQNGW
jgi:hypothetical protein